MAHSENDGDEEITGINVVPLVDIVLVLLIIFMVTANFMSKPAIDLDLPTADTGDRKERNQFSLLLGKDGSVAIGAKRIRGEDFSDQLERVIARFKGERRASLRERGVSPSALQLEAMARAELTMIISADRAVPHGRVIHFIDSARRRGVRKYAFNVSAAPQQQERGRAAQ
jgi:biopolymer transport protein ExbD